jgi:tetratricopeptide (TPR) repeat protein
MDNIPDPTRPPGQPAPGKDTDADEFPTVAPGTDAREFPPVTRTPDVDRTRLTTPGTDAGEFPTVAADTDAYEPPPVTAAVRTPGPAHVPGFEILRVLGRGGMGVVYEARQVALKRTVALKMILAGGHAGPAELARFRTEGEAVARLQHPNVVQIYEVGEADGLPFFALEFCPGGALDKHLKGTPQPPAEAARLLRSLAAGVQAAHEKNIVHRDLKPANVLFAADRTPKVTDFGLAKRLDAAGDTASGALLGTPSYMAPEQAQGKGNSVGPAADVYALGAILYECLTGRPPFKADTLMDTVNQVVTAEPVPPRQLNLKVPRDLETVCLKCLHKDPARRYAAAADLAEELDRFLAGKPVRARPVGPFERAGRWCRRNPLAAGLALLGVFLLVGGTSLSTYYAVLAKSRAEGAERGAQIAISTLETVIYTVHDKLADIPAARGVRRELLQSAVADLKRISSEYQTQRRIDRGTGTALYRLAIVYRDLGSETGGDAGDSAVRCFEQAAAIFEPLLAKDPDNDDLRRELAYTYDKLGQLFLDAKLLPRARDPLRKAIELRTLNVQRQPDNSLYRYHLAISLACWGDLERESGQPEAARRYYREARELGERLVAAEPQVGRYQEHLAVSFSKEGDICLDLNETAAARERFEACSKILTELYKKEPKNPHYRMGLSDARERMGDWYFKTGDTRHALTEYEEMLRLTVETMAEDPNNLRLISDLAIAYDNVAKARRAVGDAKGAADAVREAAESRRRLNQAGAAPSAQPAKPK